MLLIHCYICIVYVASVVGIYVACNNNNNNNEKIIIHSHTMYDNDCYLLKVIVLDLVLTFMLNHVREKLIQTNIQISK